MLKKIISLAVLACATTASANHSAGLSGGIGEPGNLKGLRAHYRYNFFDYYPFNFYLDASIANWSIDSDFDSNVTIFALAPVIRANVIYPHGYNFFLELSIGPSYKSTRYVGNIKTGSNFNFQDILGVGTVIRDKFSISLNYVHYSNASLAKPNTGIDVSPMLSLSYHF